MLTINPNVVKALMTLRGVTVKELANLIHAKESLVWQWLDDTESEEDKPTPEREKEIMTILGMADSRPRGDVVHYWKVKEDFFCNVDDTYAALYVMMEVFGEAKLIHIGRETDKLFDTTAKAVFGLQFDSFYALLEITGHPWRSIRFDVKRFPKLSWASSAPTVIVSEEEYDVLEPGAMSVFALNKRVQFSTEVPLWDTLRELALNRGVSAEEVMRVLSSSEGGALLRDYDSLEQIDNVTVEVSVEKPVEVPIPKATAVVSLAQEPLKPEVAVPFQVAVPTAVAVPSSAASDKEDDFSTPIRR